MKRIIILAIVAAMSVATALAQPAAKYHGEVNIGYSIGVGSVPINRVMLNTIQGVKIGDFFSTGLGVGLDWYRGLYADYWESQGKVDSGELVMPLYLNVKGYLPINTNVSPYLTFDVGYGAGVTEGVKGFGGLYLTPGVGVCFGKIKAEIGFNIQQIVENVKINANAVKLSIGYIF